MCSDPEFPDPEFLPCTRYEARELPAGPVARQARERYLAFTETS